MQSSKGDDGGGNLEHCIKLNNPIESGNVMNTLRSIDAHLIMHGQN